MRLTLDCGTWSTVLASIRAFCMLQFTWMGDSNAEEVALLALASGIRGIRAENVRL